MAFLADILARKREEVQVRKAALPLAQLERRLDGVGPTRSLEAALSLRGGPLKIIAEVKRASPSVGSIDRNLDPVALAQSYQSAGASAISVLTDGPGFGGSLEDLTQVRAAVTVPLLRKDFILDRYQLIEARVAGADAALLIVAALEGPLLRQLLSDCASLNLEALVEVHDASELEIALGAGARMIGINNRDLRTFAIDLGTSEALLSRVPTSVRAVAESGVKGVVEVDRLCAAGACNLLIGEALVRDQLLLGKLLSAGRRE